eukprot:495144_1
MAASVIRIRWRNLGSIFSVNDTFQSDKAIMNIMNITNINGHEFIISSFNPLSDDRQLFKYNIDTNTFNELSIDDNNWYCGNMDFNNKEQILYIKNGTKIISINMKTNKSTSLLGAEPGNY